MTEFNSGNSKGLSHPTLYKRTFKFTSFVKRTSDIGIYLDVGAYPGMGYTPMSGYTPTPLSDYVTRYREKYTDIGEHPDGGVYPDIGLHPDFEVYPDVVICAYLDTQVPLPGLSHLSTLVLLAHPLVRSHGTHEAERRFRRHFLVAAVRAN
jgi:hypothetical protein